jgi:hypothetical protein
MAQANRKKIEEATIKTLGDVAGPEKKNFINQRVLLIGCEKPAVLPGWGQTTAVVQPVTVFDVKRFGNPKLGLVQLLGMFDDGGRAMAFLSVNTVVELAPVDMAQVPDSEFSREVVRQHQVAFSTLALNGAAGTDLGADPEIFAVKGDGSLFPAFEFLPDHEEAIKRSGVPGFSDFGFAYHPFWDGYQAEFNVRPNGCIAYVVDSIRGGLKRALEEARKVDPRAELSLKTTMDIPLERLATDDRRYVQFGCTPSLNVYSDETFPEVESDTIPFRSAGGHIHFTHTKDNIKEVVKGLDRILGVLCVSLFQKYDDPRRRILYGRAGEYRKTSYGLEYRVLSNAWLCNPIVTNMVYELARRIARAGDWAAWVASEKEVRDCINNCDVEAAHRILNRNINQLHAIVNTLPSGPAGTARLVKIIFDGVHTALSEPDKVSKSWFLEGGGWAGHAESRTNSLGRWAAHNKMDLFD